MRFDASIPLSLFDRKRARLETLAVANEPEVWFDALVRLMKWMLAEPMLRAYVKQIVANYDAEERAVMRVLRKAPEKLAKAAADVRERSAWTQLSDSEDWKTFENSIESTKARGTSARNVRGAILSAAEILVEQGNKVVRGLSRASKSVAAKGRKVADETSLLVSEPHRASPREEMLMTDTLDSDERTSREAFESYEAFDAEWELSRSADQLARPYIEILEFWEREETYSSRVALQRLIRICRGFAPPRGGPGHWTDVLDKDRSYDAIMKRELKKSPDRYRTEALRDLATLAEELHVIGASSLSYGVVVERFAERCAWYDKERMRAVAKRGAGKREDRLTLELAKYMHDCGTFVLVRPRVSNLEPDVVALRGFGDRGQGVRVQLERASRLGRRLLSASRVHDLAGDAGSPGARGIPGGLPVRRPDLRDSAHHDARAVSHPLDHHRPWRVEGQRSETAAAGARVGA